MARTSIFSLCGLAVCAKKLILMSLALSIVYLVLWNFSFVSDWPNKYLSPTPQISPQLSFGIDSNRRTDKRRKHKESNRTRAIDAGLVDLNSENIYQMSTSLLIDSVRHTDDKKICPKIEENPLLMGHVGQATLLIEELEEREVELANPEINPGGSWRPMNCTPRHKVAVVIPYRDRKSHLVRLLDFLIPLLKKQYLDFRFIVTEQNGDGLFNKGRIMNAAFRFGRDQLGVDCVIFHDVDMFPQDDRTPYGCPDGDGPRHVGAFVSNLGYQLWYKEIVGGVLAINVKDYETVNGFSNSYWAWGGEDDDMGKRILSHNYSIERPNSDFVRFSMLKHVKRKRLASKLVYKLLEETEKRMERDGLNEAGKWELLKVDVRPLYYHLLINVGEPPNEWKS